MSNRTLLTLLTVFSLVACGGISTNDEIGNDENTTDTDSTTETTTDSSTDSTDTTTDTESTTDTDSTTETTTDSTTTETTGSDVCPGFESLFEIEACDTCLGQSCCEVATVWQNDPVTQCWFDCYLQGKQPSEALALCGPNHEDVWNDFFGCASEYCEMECNSSPDVGTLLDFQLWQS